jgi:hypothetical protein
MPNDKLTKQKISSIIGNSPLASDLHQGREGQVYKESLGNL